jgi:hypothetical protein
LGLLNGEYTAEDLSLFSHKFEEAVQKFNKHRILLDKTKFLNHFDYHDAVVFADSPISDFMVNKRLRIAALIRPSNLEVERAYETLMRNRSVNYKPFISQEEAMDWLLK